MLKSLLPTWWCLGVGLWEVVSFRWALEGEVIIMRLISLKEEKERPELSLYLVKTQQEGCCGSLTQSCLILCESMNCSTPDSCPVLSPRVCSNSRPLSYLTISFSVTLFSSCSQSLPASGSSPMSWLFASDGQSIGASASALPMNIQDWFPLGLIGLISLQFKGLSAVFSGTTVWKHELFGAQPSLWSNAHIHTLEKSYPWLYWPLWTKWCLCFLIHCLGLLSFLPRSIF